ncbi:MAG TPA: formylglycine-generating enzyme family protein [Micropepsaceae bacterium]|nr:formylglycine-generating enzyme family protein [Micropepsaceae bacterium]
MRRIRIAAFLTALLGAPGAIAVDNTDREFKECDLCPLMVGIPAGSFTMGSPVGEPGRFDTEGPTHAVNLRAFALAKYDVTSDEFLAFLKDTGYQPAPCNPRLMLGWRSPGKGIAYAPYVGQPPRWPAVCLDWKDANAYIAWLNKKVHAARPALGDAPGPYRLPSESEWEYAARAGTETARWWGENIDVNRANCNGCGSAYDYRWLADVDSFAPNWFGLYGMLGNAWQWTQDCWHESYAGAPTDGRAWMTGDCGKHVIRGGSWSNLPIFVRSAARSGSGPDGGEYDYSSLSGFRIARSLP